MTRQTRPPVMKLVFDPQHTAENGPALVDRRTRQSGLAELSAGFFDFPDGGEVGPWTLPYEEVLYVVRGRLSLEFDGTEVVAESGEMVSLERGATATYKGTPGTKVVFSLVPANWQETQ